MVSEQKKALEVFFSYSHVDQDLRDRLEIHLSILKSQGVISSWHDRKIIPGVEWASEIDTHLDTAQIILLLISADFLASPYCTEVEVMRAMERHDARQARVIPIILHYCNWQSAPFGKLQALPTDGKPIDSRHWYNKDEAFLNVAQGIKKAIEDIHALENPVTIQSNRLEGFSQTGEKLTLPKPKVNKSFNPYKVRDEWIDYITSNLQETIENEESLDFYVDDFKNTGKYIFYLAKRQFILYVFIKAQWEEAGKMMA